MRRIDRCIVKARILKLAGLRGTGSPSELAMRLDISVRSVKRLVSEIRYDGQEIWYCQSRKSYVMGSAIQR